MSLIQQKILGISITAASEEKILEHLEKYLSSAFATTKRTVKNTVKPLIIVTPNPEQIVLATHDKWFERFINRADITLPDGIGVIMAAKILNLGKRGERSAGIRKRIAGIDFMRSLVSLAAKQRVRIGLIGGFNGLAVKALECLTYEHPKLTGWAIGGPELLYRENGIVEGPDASYWSRIAEKIIESKTSVVFVGLGVPKQEYAIEKITTALTQKHVAFPVVCMAVGGSFTMIADKLHRAPLFIRSIGFEWFWRLLQEPWRWKRQIALIRFIWLVCEARIVAVVATRRK